MSTRRPVEAERGTPLSRSGALIRILFQITFWVPLVICTWLALTPRPPEKLLLGLSDVILHTSAFAYLSLALIMARLRGSESPAYGKTALFMMGYGLLLEVIHTRPGSPRPASPV